MIALYLCHYCFTAKFKFYFVAKCSFTYHIIRMEEKLCCVDPSLVCVYFCDVGVFIYKLSFREIS